MFWIRYTDGSGTHEVSLTPTPTDVEYPLGDGSKVLTSQDGNVIFQRPLRDGRPRKWIWRGFGPNDASYSSLWSLLQSQTSKSRLAAGLSSAIEVWEDVTGAGSFDKTDGSGNKVYTTVRVYEASRKPAPAGPIAYESTFTFYIQDANYSV